MVRVATGDMEGGAKGVTEGGTVSGATGDTEGGAKEFVCFGISQPVMFT